MNTGIKRVQIKRESNLPRQEVFVQIRQGIKTKCNRSLFLLKKLS